MFSWLNHKYLPLAHSVGLLAMSVAASLVLVAIDTVFPQKHLFEAFTDLLLQLNFSTVVIDGMLGLLLFAGALHVNFKELRGWALPVIILAVIGTIISTGLVGLGV